MFFIVTKNKKSRIALLIVNAGKTISGFTEREQAKDGDGVLSDLKRKVISADKLCWPNSRI